MPLDEFHDSLEDGFDSLQATIRLPSLPQRQGLIELLMAEAIQQPIIADYRDRAQFTFFCGADPSEQCGYESQLEAVGRCLEWFVFDYHIPEVEATPAQYWFMHHGECLSAEQRQSIRQALRFVLSVYEITHVQPGDSFIARDLLRNPLSYPVRESVVTGEIAEQQLLFGRLFPSEGSYQLSGMAAFMNASATARMKALIRDGRIRANEVTANLDGVGLENLFQRSLRDIDTINDEGLVRRRLRDYLTRINPGHYSLEDLFSFMGHCDDPFEFAARATAQLDIACNHEVDVVCSYMIRWWELCRGEIEEEGFFSDLFEE